MFIDSFSFQQRANQSCWAVPSFYLIFTSVFLVSGLVRAEIGTVQIQGNNPANMAPIEEDLFENSDSFTPMTEVASPETTAILAEGERVNRTWMLRTSAGPSAFVLDSQQFEFGILYTRFTQLIWLHKSFPILFDLNYGLSDSITLLMGANHQVAQTGIKWNFWNPGRWSFSITPSIGYSFKEDTLYSSSSSKQAPYSLSIGASGLISKRNKLHFILEAGQNTEKYSYSYSSHGNISGNDRINADRLSQLTTVRLAAAYEIRFNRQHGMTFWIAPEVWSMKETSSNSISASTASENSKTRFEAGLGYQYLRETFGLEVGMGAGPQSERYRSNNSHDMYRYQNNYIELSLTGGLSWRI